ncbi:MAG: LysR family transcriptional regulator [Alphaproteobacteria bacterium]|jgi:DNA-binding transcriptional LysR family regulator|nr:LysR family transcriptional regulator [Alphaproteobacteria bacterium]
MSFDLNKLRTFYTVVRCGGLTKSQDLLGIKVSSISSQISLLEKEIGSTLLTSSKSGVRLTQTGEKLYSLLKSNLPNLERIQEIIGSNDKDLTGTLKISTWMGVGVYLISECIMDFMKKNPKLTVALLGDNSEIDFNAYEYDAAIREYIPNREDLIQTELVSYSHKLYASKGYIEKYGMPKKIGDLDQHKLISTSITPLGKFQLVDWHLTAGKEKGQHRQPYIVINSTAGVEKFIKEDLGIGTLAPFYDSVVTHGLVELFPEYEKPKLTFYFIYQKSMGDFEKIRSFEAYLVQKIHKQNIEF